MNSSQTAPAARASFTLNDEADANRAANLLAESFDNNEAAVAAFERPDGAWDVTVYFAAQPDPEAVRSLVALACGEDAARTVTFDTVAAAFSPQASETRLRTIPGSGCAAK